jgi:hypothetical protein
MDAIGWPSKFARPARSRLLPRTLSGESRAEAEAAIRNSRQGEIVMMANAKNAAVADGKPAGTAMVRGKPLIRYERVRLCMFAITAGGTRRKSITGLLIISR